MRTSFLRPYLLIIIVIFSLMSLSADSTEKIRGATIAFLAPVWNALTNIKETFKLPKQPSREFDIELQQLHSTNQLLNAEINYLQHLLKDNLNLKQDIVPQQQMVPALVIFRSPASWNSSLWINVGDIDNPSPENKVIAKNSPVLLNDSLIGVLDYVGKHQSRVRLITDSGISPSVRAVRGGEQDRFLNEQIKVLVEMLERRRNLLFEDKQDLIKQLKELGKHLNTDQSTRYLAKGELHGTSQPLWRTQNNLLKGRGFNYDFADEYGPARDLRTGKVINDQFSKPIPLLKVGDLLVTTGMDGIFPEGLKVAEIIKIDMLKEGDYYYDLEAKPTAGNLNDLSTVFVIPPLGYDSGEKPPLIGR